MTSLEEVHVVSHTHWDREWYHTEERFRQRLVLLIDELLDDPPASGESFLLDGQAILLDDYLAVRPERAAELATMIRDGRIEAGPWYVLADNLIAGGEALVRNLLIGRETVRRLRGDAPPVLYCPDSFGHPAILPDLAAGFGFGLIVAWRGVRAEHGRLRWQSATGDDVALYHLPPDGYEFGSSLPTADVAAAERWKRLEPVLAARAMGGVAMLLNGADHHARQRDRLPAVGALASAAAPVRMISSSLRAASSALVDAARRATSQPYTGEHRDSYGETWTLQGTFATRAHQKRANAAAERTLVCDVEPWLALAGASGSDRALLGHAWRTLLQAHPHDSLCGTSIDEVASAVDARFASTMVQAEELRARALNALMGHDVEAARAMPGAWRPVVVIRNPVAHGRSGVVELTLSATAADVGVGPGSAARQGEARAIAPWRVEGMEIQVVAERETIALTEAPRAYPDADRVREARALGWMAAIGGYELRTVEMRAGNSAPIPHPVVGEGLTLTNGLVELTVSEEGRVALHDLSLDRRVDDVLRFMCERDAGDLYTPSLREALPAPVVRSVRATLAGPIRGEIVIALAYGEGSGASTCDVAVQLDANAQWFRVRLSGDNRERDHRLRIVFDAVRDASPLTVADAAFRAVVREPLRDDAWAQSMETPLRTAPLHRWVARVAPHEGVVIASDGLAEYESRDDSSVAITLVRSVGQLSRVDLPERPGHAGWPRDTPGAQCSGPFAGVFAVQLFGNARGSAVPEMAERLAEELVLPIIGETLRSNRADGRRAGGLELIGDGLTFSAAYPSQQGGWTVLRCVNERDTPVEGEWRIARAITEAHRARLDETTTKTCDTEAGTIRFTAAPHEIVTILVR